jgi:hypothetical protein
MSHNPPRVWFTDKDAERVAREVASRPRPRWQHLGELCEWIRTRAHANKRVILAPDTALIVAGHLEVAHAKPTRDEIALMICKRGASGRCDAPCYDCAGRANMVARAYGCRFPGRATGTGEP